MNNNQLLAVQQLSFNYGHKPALIDVSFELPQGMTILLGPNGAGKSTLFSLLTQIYGIQQGDIYFNQISVTKLGYQAMQWLGVVFQQSTLDLDLTIAQNLYYFGHLHGYSRQQSLTKAHPLLMQFELQHRLHEKVRRLNSGHRRRLEIVRALMHQPKVLLLDEPSVGLDPASRQALADVVRDLCREQKICVLWATHLIEEASDEDNVLILNQGQLLATGRSRELQHRYQQASLAEVFMTLTSEV